MSSDFKEENGVIIIELEGKIMGSPQDTAMLNKFYEYADKGYNKFILDFCNVEWINSRGLGLCIAILTSLNDKGGSLRLTCLNEKVKTILDRNRMFAIFETSPTVQDALTDLT